MSESQTIVPPAKSLIIGLRSMGYSFSTAIADIIDNSISAGAKHIDVFSDPGASSPYLAIFDDGCGMGKRVLLNAMTIGSDRSNKEDTIEELGRFGLGLKTASFSQCLRLTVASKDSSHINAMRYDIEEIQKQNDWVLNILDDNEIDKIPEIQHLKNVKTGTLVVWEKFDTIMEEATPSKFVNAFNAAVSNASTHVAFVFHRFYKDVEISFNGHRVPRRDPFLEGYPKTQEGREMPISFNGEQIMVKPFILPNTNSLTAEQKELLGNPKNVSEDQGIYLYRNERLISWGSWLRMNPRSEFNKLARVRIDIPSALDSAWRIDVKKSSAKVPEAIREQIMIAIKDASGKSTREVKHRGRKESEAHNSVWQRFVNSDTGVVRYELNKDYPLYNDIIADLEPVQRQKLMFYIQKIEQLIPVNLIYDDGASSNITFSGFESDPDLDENEDNLLRLINTCYHGSLEMLDTMLDSQGYQNLKDRRAEMVERLRDETRD